MGKRVGSKEASLSRPSGGPPCSPPMCRRVAEGWLASKWWLTSGGPLAGRWCCDCMVCNGHMIMDKPSDRRRRSTC